MPHSTSAVWSPSPPRPVDLSSLGHSHPTTTHPRRAFLLLVYGATAASVPSATLHRLSASCHSSHRTRCIIVPFSSHVPAYASGRGLGANTSKYDIHLITHLQLG